MISHHAALIYTMVLISAADGDMTDAELRVMSELVSFLPLFRDYDSQLLPETVGACVEILEQENGLDEAMALIRGSVPWSLRETAYLVACEVATADGEVGQEETRLLDLLRETLGLERLVAAAIERGARARYARLSDNAGTTDLSLQ